MKRLIFAAFIFAACGEPYKGPNPAGHAYFSQAGCIACHKVGEEGSAVGPDLTLVGFRHSPEWLDLFIKDPTAWKKDTLMPNKRISDEARGEIVKYLAGQKGDGWTRPWANVAEPERKGLVIYTRAGCVGCHGPLGAGGYPNNNVKGGLIPKLNGVYEAYTKAELIAKIKNGVPHPAKADLKGPEPMIWMPAWGEKLDAGELDAVATYLLSLKPANAEKPEF